MNTTPPVGAGEPSPTPADIDNWPTQHLSDAATAWRTAAGTSTDAFEQHRRNILFPAGTDWEGTAKDAALGRVDGDIRVAGYHGEVLTEAASAAEDGLTSLKAAKREAVAAINEATDDGFTVGDDLSVTDARPYNVDTVLDRNKAATEHAENIRWTTEKLVEADAFVAQRLHAKATELHGLRFEGEGNDNGSHVQMVDNKTTTTGGDKDKPDDKPGQKPDGAGDPSRPRTWQDLMLPPDKPNAATAPKPGDPPATPLDLLARQGQHGKPGTAPEHPKTAADMLLPAGPPTPVARPTLDPNSPEGKAAIATMRQMLSADPKLTPAEIDQRINTALANMDKPLPVAAGPEEPGPKPPLPSLGEQLGDKFNTFINDAHNQFYNRLDSAVNTAENLTGLGGAGHPGVAEAWEQLGKAHLSEVAQDPLRLHDPTGPLGPWAAASATAMHDIPEMIEHPGKLAGDKLFDGTVLAATSLPGTEGLLGRMLMPEASALEHGVASGTGHALEHGATPITPHGPTDVPAAPHGPVEIPPTGDHGLVGHGGDASPPVEHHTADAPVEHHVSGDTGHVAPYGVEDTSALLSTSEAAGGHLLDRHVGQTVEDLSARLDSTRLPVVSSFGTADEAASAVSAALQHNRPVIDEWLSNGAVRYIELDAPFSGGSVLERGSSETVAGTGVRVVLKGDGNGGWYVLTGFPTP